MPDNHEIHATGPDETRSLRLSKPATDHYRIIIWWGKGDKVLATLNFTAEEWERLIAGAEELRGQ
jgi:hypothetical protein